MIDKPIERSGLFQTCLTKIDDYFILDLKSLVAKGYYLNIENLGDSLKFTCFVFPPKKLNVSNEEFVVSIPSGIYNSTQLRRLAQIIEKLITIEELKIFRFFEFFFDNFVDNDWRNREYFLLDRNERYNSDFLEKEESNVLMKTLYEKNLDDLGLSEALKPLIYTTIRKKISVMHGLLNHFTKNTNLLIEQVMDKFDEKASDLNKRLETAKNKILIQESRVSRLNDIAWEILKQYCDEQKLSSFSESETVVSSSIGHLANTERSKKEILTLQEALQMRKSYGGEGLPEDFGSPDKLLQAGKIDNSAPNNMVETTPKKKIDFSKNNIKPNQDPLNTEEFQAHTYLKKLNFVNLKTLHPAEKQLAKIQSGFFLYESKNTQEIHKKINNNIYDPISEYTLKNSDINSGGKTLNLRNHSMTVFSYLGRPIPVLNHQNPSSIPKPRVIESIQLSMNTEISKNEKWQHFGRPVEKREMRPKSPKELKVKPLKHKLNEFDIPKKDVYNILL